MYSFHRFPHCLLEINNLAFERREKAIVYFAYGKFFIV